MIAALLLLLVGLMFSAFFSGSEAGLYRVNRVRLLLDALGGDWISRGLLSLTNHPSFFVATVLVGNNMANYVTSLAMVLGVQALFPGDGGAYNLLAPVVLAPFLFVYGELLPKNIYMQVPNHMLRRLGLPVLVCTWLFSPITALLWALSKAIEWLSGESPQQIRLGLARRELQQMLEEGHDLGILQPAQRSLVQGLFATAALPASRFVIPIHRFPRARLNMSKAEIRRLASQHQVTAIPVERADDRQLIGHFNVVDLYLDPSDRLPPVRPLVDISEKETQLAALMRLAASPESLGRVTSTRGQTIGFLTARQLSEPLFRGS